MQEQEEQEEHESILCRIEIDALHAVHTLQATQATLIHRFDVLLESSLNSLVCPWNTVELLLLNMYLFMLIFFPHQVSRSLDMLRFVRWLCGLSMIDNNMHLEARP